MTTSRDIDINDSMVINRLDSYINQFFKILPIKENGDETLGKYMLSLQREMLGCQSLIVELHYDSQYLTLLSILEYLIDNDCDVSVVRSEVFKAINILKKMRDRYDAAHKG